jgi:hypothetical protein
MKSIYNILKIIYLFNWNIKKWHDKQWKIKLKFYIFNYYKKIENT